MLGIGLALFVLGCLTYTRISYNTICGRCLQQKHGLERRAFGSPFYWRQWPEQRSAGLASPAGLGPRIPQVDPGLYKKIFQRPCQHAFKRGGVCTYTFGMVKCGSSREASTIRYRLELIERIYRLYLKHMNAELARRSFQIVDQLQPIDGDTSKMMEMLECSERLALVSSLEDWREVLDFQQGIAATGTDPRKDHDKLVKLFREADPEIRGLALNHLAQLKTPAAWEVVGQALSDTNYSYGAAGLIITERYPPLLGKALRVAARKQAVGRDEIWPFSGPLWTFDGRIEDEELRALLKLDDPFVDRYCLAQIWSLHRYGLLEDVLAVHSERLSAASKIAIDQLLLGPSPFGQITLEDVTRPDSDHYSFVRHDPWTTLKRRISIDMGRGDHETDRIQRQVVALGKEGTATNWDAIHAAWERWVTMLAAEWWAAAFAQALQACDAERTEQWLGQQLQSTNLHLVRHRFSCLLAAAGAVANPRLVSSLERISPTNASSAQIDGGLDLFLRYALHRCRRIQDGRLVQDQNGRYVIENLPPTPGVRSEPRVAAPR